MDASVSRAVAPAGGRRERPPRLFPPPHLIALSPHLPSPPASLPPVLHDPALDAFSRPLARSLPPSPPPTSPWDPPPVGAPPPLGSSRPPPHPPPFTPPTTPPPLSLLQEHRVPAPPSPSSPPESLSPHPTPPSLITDLFPHLLLPAATPPSRPPSQPRYCCPPPPLLTSASSRTPPPPLENTPPAPPPPPLPAPPPPSPPPTPPPLFLSPPPRPVPATESDEERERGLLKLRLAHPPRKQECRRHLRARMPGTSAFVSQGRGPRDLLSVDRILSPARRGQRGDRWVVCSTALLASRM